MAAPSGIFSTAGVSAASTASAVSGSRAKLLGQWSRASLIFEYSADGMAWAPVAEANVKCTAFDSYGVAHPLELVPGGRAGVIPSATPVGAGVLTGGLDHITVEAKSSTVDSGFWRLNCLALGSGSIEYHFDF